MFVFNHLLVAIVTKADWSLKTENDYYTLVLNAQRWMCLWWRRWQIKRLSISSALLGRSTPPAPPPHRSNALSARYNRLSQPTLKICTPYRQPNFRSVGNNLLTRILLNYTDFVVRLFSVLLHQIAADTHLNQRDWNDIEKLTTARLLKIFRILRHPKVSNRAHDWFLSKTNPVRALHPT